MAKKFNGGGEKTSPSVAKIASQGLRNPGSLTKREIQKIAGSALTQAANKSKRGK